jgi:hypothetical protein
MKHKCLTLILLILFLIPISAFSSERTWRNPLPQGNSLWNLWGRCGTDVFAVGEYGTILHYEGIGWLVPFLSLP